MKTFNLTLSKINFLWKFMIIFILVSCDDGDGDGDVTPEQLLPIIELSSESIGPGGETLTIDGSASTGTSENTIYVWTVTGQSGIVSYGENETSLSNSNNTLEFSTSESIIQFTSVGTGEVSVNLRLEDQSSFANASSVVFTVAGSVNLSEVPDGYEFIEINADQSTPDYIFDGDVNITNATFIEGGAQYLIFQVTEGAQVTIDGTLSMGNGTLVITSPQETTWKGLKIGNAGNIIGSSGYSLVTLLNAGGSSIGDYEPSALVLETPTAPSIYLTTENCQGYDVNFSNSVTSLEGSNQLLQYTGDGNGVYAPIHLWGYLSAVNNKLTLESYIDVQQSLVNGNNIQVEQDVYIRGNGATISNFVTFNGSGTIYVEEDAALIFGNGVVLVNGINIKAIDDAPWRGIYIGSNNNSSIIGNATITNAGSEIIESGAITTTDKAAIYVQGRGLSQFTNNTISGSGGYGIYNNANIVPTVGKEAYQGNTFENTVNAAVRLPQDYGAMFSGNNNTFNLDNGVAAVEVFQTSSGTVYSNWTWDTLGESNYYHFTDNLNITSGNMTIAAGAHFKFNVAKGFVFTTNNGILRFQGNAEASVLIEAAETSWGGLFIGGTSMFIANYLTIDSGGDVMFTGATEMANLVLSTNLGGAPNGNQFSIFNSTFSNSTAGWGAVLDVQNSFSIDLEDPAFGNSFEGNQLGSFLDKNL